MTQHTDDLHFQVSCPGQMQPAPPGGLDEMAFGIGTLPLAIGLSIRAGVATLKALPIFAWRPAFARGRRSGAIQHPLRLSRSSLSNGSPAAASRNGAQLYQRSVATIGRLPTSSNGASSRNWVATTKTQV